MKLKDIKSILEGRDTDLDLEVSLWYEHGEFNLFIANENGSGCTYIIKSMAEIGESLVSYIANYCEEEQEEE